MEYFPFHGTFINVFIVNKLGKMEKQHIFQFGVLDLFDFYAVIACNRDVNIDFTEVHEIDTVLQFVYDQDTFGLIANRKNFYSVNPLAINKFFSNENLIVGAIVGYTKATEGNAVIEKMVIQNAPIEYFVALEDAKDWVRLKMKESDNM